MSQPPKPIQCAAEKTARTVLSSCGGFGSARAKPQRTISFLFYRWDRAALVDQIAGREYLNSKRRRQSKSRQIYAKRFVISITRPL